MSRDANMLDEDRIAAYLRGDLSEASRAEVEAWMDREPQWLGVLAHLAADLESSTQAGFTGEGSSIRGLRRAAAIRLHAGQQVGRFVIDRALGRGGMGTVYAAHDPTLGRDVALKLLHATDEADQQRLWAEARTLAQINHPNVITVHDVSPWRSRLFIAMELLDGETLLAWRMRAAPSWEQVVDAYIDAARGLAAAHEAGVVHRDIKPTNLMITHEGRVVVVDFGLALDMSSMVTVVQSTVSNVGTPAYMAPEQRRGEESTDLSDQYALCVALFEALTGALPAGSASGSRPAPFGALPRVPKRVHDVVAKGLQEQPDRRHASVRALVEALTRARHPRRWPIFAAAGIAAVAGAVTMLSEEPEAVMCTGGDDRLAPTWNPSRREAVHGALVALRGAWSTKVADTVVEDVDAYAQAWMQTYRSACENTLDDERLGARMACLDLRRRSLDALVGMLTEADESVGLHAIQAVAGLDDAQTCLQESGSPRAPASEQADEIRELLSRAEMLRQSNQLEAATQNAEAALRASAVISSDYLEAEARLVLGWIEHDAGRFEQSRDHLRLGLAAATVSRNDAAVSTALHRLAWVVGYKLGRHAQGRKLCDQAQAWSARLGHREQDDISRAMTRGWIAHEESELDESRAQFERAAELANASSKPDAGLDVALALNGLGSAHLSAGDLDAAQSVFERSASALATLLGPAHPKVGQVVGNRGSVLRAMGRPEEALALFERARTIVLDAYGPEHLFVGQVAINTTIVLNDLGRYEDALQMSEEALGVLTKVVGEQHLLVARAHVVRGDAFVHLGKLDEGVAEFHRALAMQSELLGPEHPALGVTLSNLSIAYDNLGKLDDAAEQQRRALDLLVTSYGNTHELVATARMNLGFLERRRGDLDEALALYEAAVEHGAPYTVPLALLGYADVLLDLDRAADAIAPLQRSRELLVDAPPTFGSRGQASFLLAKAQWRTGDRAGSRASAAEAAALIDDEDDDAMAEEIAAWRARH